MHLSCSGGDLHNCMLLGSKHVAKSTNFHATELLTSKKCPYTPNTSPPPMNILARPGSPGSHSRPGRCPNPRSSRCRSFSRAVYYGTPSGRPRAHNYGSTVSTLTQLNGGCYCHHCSAVFYFVRFGSRQPDSAAQLRELGYC